MNVKIIAVILALMFVSTTVVTSSAWAYTVAPTNFEYDVPIITAVTWNSHVYSWSSLHVKGTWSLDGMLITITLAQGSTITNVRLDGATIYSGTHSFTGVLKVRLDSRTIEPIDFSISA